MTKVLILVDMQNDFVDGSLGTKEAQAIISKAVERIKQAIKDGYEIFVTKDTHFNDYLNTLEGKKLPIKHCIMNSHGWQLNNEIETALKECEKVHLFCKNTFGSEDMLENLYGVAGEAFDEYEIFGLCTDICVIANAILIKTHYPESKVVVNSSCCAGTTPEMHEAALKVMQSCQIDII